MHIPQFRSRHRRRHRSRGQSLVELALILPVFLLLLLTAIDLGRLLYSQITITNAAKEGALVASQGGTFQSNQACSDTNEVMCGVLTEADGGFVEVDKARVTLTPAVCVKDAMYPSSGAPPAVAVAVQAPFRIMTPVIGSIIGSNLILNATANAQCLVVPRVTYPALPKPTAAFTASRVSGSSPLSVNFDASSSSSPGATITTYTWSFGAVDTDASFRQSFTTTTVVTLTVTDSRGQVSDPSAPITITVTGGPTPPVCPNVSFTWVASPGGGPNAHRVRFDGAVSPSSGGWTWSWTGPTVPAPPVTGQNPQISFGAAGLHSVTLTATKGACTLVTTQTVTAP